MIWYLGEEKNAYAEVSADVAFVIDSVTYVIYNCADESVVKSGTAVIDVDTDTIYIRWLPTEVGLFVVQFTYIIESESFISRQVIEVKETM